VIALVLVLAVGASARRHTVEVEDWSFAQKGADWGGLCSSGKHQSPIDIQTENKDTTVCVRDGEDGARTHKIDYHYNLAQNVSFSNNGHVFKLAAPLGFVTLGGCNPCDGKQFDASAVYLHAPSEHTINGKSYAMELNIVHTQHNGPNRVAVSILFYVQPEGGFPNSFLQHLDWDHLPATAGASNPVHGFVDLGRLAESLKGEYYSYDGSTTSPATGCSENTTWFVMKRPLGVTADQLAKFQAVFPGGNSRAVQPLNDRKVYWYRKRV